LQNEAARYEADLQHLRNLVEKRRYLFEINQDLSKTAIRIADELRDFISKQSPSFPELINFNRFLVPGAIYPIVYTDNGDMGYRTHAGGFTEEDLCHRIHRLIDNLRQLPLTAPGRVDLIRNYSFIVGLILRYSPRFIRSQLKDEPEFI
jgi:hypothetical protein